MTNLLINLLLVSFTLVIQPSYGTEDGGRYEPFKKGGSSEGFSSLIISLFLPQDVEPERFIPMAYYAGRGHEARFINDGSIEGDIKGDGIFTALLKCARNQAISFYLFEKGSGGMNPIFKKEIIIRDEEPFRLSLSVNEDGKVEEKSEDVAESKSGTVEEERAETSFTKVHLYIFFTIFLFFFFLLLFLHYEIKRGVDTIVAAIRKEEGTRGETGYNRL